MTGSPFCGDGCHCSVTGVEAMVAHVAALMSDMGADFVVTDSCIVAIEEGGSSLFSTTKSCPLPLPSHSI